ncbi:MAG: glycosyltransferase, partial [Phycisphaerae bacterium]
MKPPEPSRDSGLGPLPLDVSIAICTRNSAPRIGRVLRALAGQMVPAGVAWEVLLIDNASDDDTGRVAAEQARQCGLALRVVAEPQPGLAHARQCAVRAARGKLTSFVDDDNIVAADWVAQAAEFMRTHPRAGLVGGQITAEFEDPKTRPGDFAERYARVLGCWDLGPADLRYPEPVLYPPCGAGLTLRTHVLRAVYRHCGSHLTGRRGGRLISGEDYELGLLILKLGWEAWYTPTLRLSHVMPPARLTEDYLRRIKVGNVQSEHWLNYLR